MRYVPNVNNFVCAQKAEVGALFATGKVALTNSDPERIFLSDGHICVGPAGRVGHQGVGNR